MELHFLQLSQPAHEQFHSSGLIGKWYNRLVWHAQGTIEQKPASCLERLQKINLISCAIKLESIGTRNTVRYVAKIELRLNE